MGCVDLSGICFIVISDGFGQKSEINAVAVRHVQDNRILPLSGRIIIPNLYRSYLLTPDSYRLHDRIYKCSRGHS